jgi:hypothetical protein
MSSIPLEEQQLSESSFEDELKSTVDKILQACPRFAGSHRLYIVAARSRIFRFRILVLGRVGIILIRLFLLLSGSR